VVDAGGKGFVRVLEGVMRLIHGHPLREVEIPRLVGAAPAATVQVEDTEDFQYCTEVLVKGDALPSSPAVRAAIAGLGGSVQVVRTEDLLRVHIHLDDPQRLFALAAGWGEVLNTKADDMREQHRMLAVQTAQAAVVVADSACDLPDEVLDRYGIGLVPLQLILGDAVVEDRVGITPAEFYARMREGGIAISTSQPTPAAFASAFEHARATADEVVAVVLSSGLSGTWANAIEARRTFARGGVHVVDSRSASFGIGLLALRGAELAEDGWTGSAIAAELERLRERSGLLLTVDTLDNLIRSGRVSRIKGRLARWLDVKPILTLDHEGRVEAADRVRGREALLPRVLEIMARRIPADTRRLRIGIAHVDCADVAEQVRVAVAERFAPADLLVWPATAVLATHAGLGAWAVFWQAEDGPPATPGNKRSRGAL
jgi:DegV family protein with EDD domain